MRAAKLTRRTVLSALGISALAPFVPVLDAEAERSGIPKRLVLFYHPFGTFIDQWRPTGTQSDFSFASSITAPLEPHKADLVVLDGLQLRYHYLEIPGDPHQAGMAMLWSGASPLHCDDPANDGTCLAEGGQDGTVGWGGGITIDQFIADRLAPPTAFRTLELGVDTYGSSISECMSYAGAGLPIPPEVDPVKAWSNLFGDFTGNELEVQRRLARRHTALATVAAELDRLHGKVSAHDRLKIEQHLAAVADVESQLDGLLGACTPPDAPTAYDPHDSTYFMETARAQIDLIVASLACDRTRIASLQLKDENGGNVSWLDPNALYFHGLSHQQGDWQTLMPLAYRDFSILFAYLVERLAAVPMPDGTRLLDNTLVAWGSAQSDAYAHSMGPIPFVLAGGCQGAIETGRWLQYPSPVNHNRLLVSIAHAMGVDDVETFGGDWDDGSGPLPSLA
jgi:hypothetical protein